MTRSFRAWHRRCSRMLVVEHDAYRLRALILRAEGQRVRIEATGESDDPEPEDALSQALAKLGAQRLPPRALLLIPEAIQTVVGASPTPDAAAGDDVQEIIRCELEARFAEQIGTRPLEETLVERGHLTYESLTALRHEMKRRATAAATDPAVVVGPQQKLGEYALATGAIDRAALQECQLIQERIRFAQLNGSSIDWTAQHVPPSRACPQPSWLVVGVNCTVRDQWIAAFGKLSLTLSAIYPLAGCAAAALEDLERVPNAALLEIHAGLIGVSRLARGQLMDFRTHYLAGQAPALDVIVKQLRGGLDRLWLAGRDKRLSELRDQLEQRLGADVRLVPGDLLEPAEGDGPRPESVAHLIGAYRHFLGHSAGLATSGVSTHEIARAGRQRPWLPVAAVVLATVTVIGASQWYQQVRHQQAQRRLDTLRVELQQCQREADELERTKQQIAEVEQSIATLDRELAEVQRHRRFFAEEVPGRSQLLPALLDAVARAASSQVVVDQIEDHDACSVRVVGWALSQVAAERFADALSTDLRSWRLELIDAPVIQQSRGRLGLDGYGIELRFGPPTVAYAARVPSNASLAREPRAPRDIP